MNKTICALVAALAIAIPATAKSQKTYKDYIKEKDPKLYKQLENRRIVEQEYNKKLLKFFYQCPEFDLYVSDPDQWLIENGECKLRPQPAI